ncbi:MAG: ABC transporter permease, partial [Gemmatimonadetes bacterium]|nr:ABC transporter permease [Gemmatimonadota bacterium]
TFRELQARSRAFEALAVVKPWQRAITGTGEPERLDGQQVSAGYFGVLGVPPALGRDFSPSDDRPDGPKVVMLSDAVWHRRFAADVSIVGRQITLNEALYTVVGVMPRGFENVLAPSAEIWSLLQYDPSPAPQSREWGHHLRMIGRVRPGARIDQAQRELDTIARDAMAPFTREPGSNMTRGLIVNALQDDVTREVKPVLLAVLGAVALVLIIACVNVTTLLLARAAQRHAEFSMRVALGAGRGRLTRQLLTESVLLAFIAGALGLGLAGAGVRALVALAPPGLPRAAAIAVDRTVFAYAFGLSTIIGGLVGLMAALQATRGDLRAGLQRGAWRGTGGQHRTRATLVVIEIALSVVLLVGAGLLLRSLERVFAIAPGFDPSHVLTMQVQLSSPKRFPDNAAFHRFYARALEAVRGVPGVVAAGFTSELPLSGDDGALDAYGVQIDERLNAAERVGASRYLVTAGYFELMRIPVRRGRSFDERDMAPVTVRLILVSEAFAKSAFGDRDPIGQRVRFGGPPSRP